MKKKHINYLVRMLRADRATMRCFWKKYPAGKKQCPDSVVEYKLQLEIIKALLK